MSDRAFIRSLEGGFNGRIIAMVIAAIVVVVALIGLVAGGFRARVIDQGVSTMTEAAGETTTTVPAKPPTAPGR